MNAYAVFCIAIVCLMIGAVLGLFAGALASVSKDRADCDTDMVDYPHIDTRA